LYSLGRSDWYFCQLQTESPKRKIPKIVKVDNGANTVVVTTADGTEKTFDFTENAGKDMGKAVGAGAPAPKRPR
jgi:hypothetical protein